MKNINKQSILELTNGGILYFQKVFPNLKNAIISRGRYRNIRNHLRGEKRPSLSCYQRDDKYLLYDHADPDFCGDVFSIYSKVSGKENFTDILNGLYKEMTGEEPIDGEPGDAGLKMEKSSLPEGIEFEIEPRSFDKLSPEEERFMVAHNITKEIMQMYGAMFLTSYTFKANSGQVYKIYSTGENIIIGYRFGDNIKVYKPNQKEYKFMWLGEKPKDYVFGLGLVKEMHDRLKAAETVSLKKERIVLCAGEKDTMSVNGLGFVSVCLNSETVTYFPEMLFLFLLDICDFSKNNFEVVIVFDDDATGKKQANLIKQKQGGYNYNVRVVEWPEKLAKAGGKDVSDWITLGLPKQELIGLIMGDGSNGPSPISPVSPSDSFEDDVVESVVEEKKTDTKVIKMQTEDGTVIGNHLQELITQELIDKLPVLLQNSIAPFEDHYRLMILTACITTLGSILRNVVGNYRCDKIYPNLYTVIVAPPASGKSQIKWARQLVVSVEKFLYSRSTKNLDKYNHDLNLAKMGELEWTEVGPEPPFEVLLIPTDITSSMWILQIADNDGYGLMYDTEIDGLVESNSGSLRQFTDSLRKASEGEPISLMRKKDRERIKIEVARMSMLISGTPGQFIKLVPDAENGLFSRMVLIKFEGDNHWINAFDPEPFDMDAHFEKLSKKVLDYFKKLDSLPEQLSFSLSPEQLIVLDKVFVERLENIRNVAGIEGRASVMRLGMITVKIAMILSTFRMLEIGQLHNQFQCYHEDFEVALELTGIILDNVVETLKSMKNDRVEHCYRGKKLDYYYALPNAFTYAKSQEIAVLENVKPRTAQKWVYEFRDKGFLINHEKGEFKKVA